MDHLIARLETVVGKLEGFTAKFCDSGDGMPLSLNGSNVMSSSVKSVAYKHLPEATEVEPLWLSAYDCLISGPLSTFVKASQLIGDTVLTQARCVEALFLTQRQCLLEMAKHGRTTRPGTPVDAVLRQTADKMVDVQEFRNQRRDNLYFNHLSAVSESIPALGWMAVASDATLFIQAMIEAGRFYANRVLAEYQTRDSVHADWVKAWTETLVELQSYVKHYQTTFTGGLWNKHQGTNSSMTGRSDDQPKPSPYSPMQTGTHHHHHRTPAIHPSQSELFPAPQRSSSNLGPVAGGDRDKTSTAGLKKRASNPETNPADHRQQEFESVMRQVNRDMKDLNMERGGFDVDRTRDSRSRVRNQHQQEHQKQLNNNNMNESACATSSPSFADKPPRQSDSKLDQSRQDHRAKPSSHARSDPHFNSSNSSSYHPDFKGNACDQTAADQKFPGSFDADLKDSQLSSSVKSANQLSSNFPTKVQSEISSSNSMNQSQVNSSCPTFSHAQMKSSYHVKSEDELSPQATLQSASPASSSCQSKSSDGEVTSDTTPQSFPITRSSLQSGTGTGTEKKEKSPRCAFDGRKWTVENYTGTKDFALDVGDATHAVSLISCDDCVIKINGKANQITVDSCNRIGVVFDETATSLDILRCQKIQAQAMGMVPSILVEQTDRCSVFLSHQSIDARIITMKSSSVVILVPDEHGDYREYSIPEQFHTQWNGDQLVTDHEKSH